jgi:hypothetical protein
MYTQKKPIENTHIVRERDRQRFRELLAVFVLGLPVGLFLLVFTWQNLEVIRLGHEATRLQKTRTELENVHKSLQFQIDRLTSLDAVEQKATTLGFRPTDPLQLVVVGNDPSTPARVAPVPLPPVVTPDAEVAQPLVTAPTARTEPLHSSFESAQHVPRQRDENLARGSEAKRATPGKLARRLSLPRQRQENGSRPADAGPDTLQSLARGARFASHPRRGSRPADAGLLPLTRDTALHSSPFTLHHSSPAARR